MSDKRKIQHEGIIALINYSTLCAQKCDVLKGHDDKITDTEEQCLRVCAEKIRQTFEFTNDIYLKNPNLAKPN
ncbi:hypothetical protein ABPG74_017836 [Tetrahymena malaccensis]